MLRSSRCRTVLYHPNPIGPHLYPSVHDIRSTASPRSACRPVDEPVRRARSPCPPRRAPTAPFFLSSLRIRFPRHWTAPRARWRACGRYLEFTPALNHPHRPRANDPRAIRCPRGARGRSATYASRAFPVLIPLWRERSVLQPPPVHTLLDHCYTHELSNSTKICSEWRQTSLSTQVSAPRCLDGTRADF